MPIYIGAYTETLNAEQGKKDKTFHSPIKMVHVRQQQQPEEGKTGSGRWTAVLEPLGAADNRGKKPSVTDSYQAMADIAAYLQQQHPDWSYRWDMITVDGKAGFDLTMQAGVDDQGDLLNALVDKFMEMTEKVDFQETVLKTTQGTCNLTRPTQIKDNGRQLKWHELSYEAKTAWRQENEPKLRAFLQQTLEEGLSLSVDGYAQSSARNGFYQELNEVVLAAGGQVTDVQLREHAQSKTPILRVEGNGGPETLPELLEQQVKGFQQHYEAVSSRFRGTTGRQAKVLVHPSEKQYAKNPVGAAQRIWDQYQYDLEYNPVAGSADQYLRGNLTQTVVELAAGNTEAAIAGLLFAWPNALNALDSVLRNNLTAEEVIKESEANFRATTHVGEDGQASAIYDFSKPRNHTTKRTSGLGQFADAAWDWLTDPNEDNVFNVKSVSNFFAGINTFIAGLKGKELPAVDDNGDPIIGTDGVAKKVVKRDLAQLISGVLITSAYTVAFVPGRYKDSDPLVNPVAPASAIPGAAAVGEAIAEGADKLLNETIGRGNAVADFVTTQANMVVDNSKSVTGDLMRMHNYNMIANGLARFGWQWQVTEPKTEAKITNERQQLFTPGGQGSRYADYIGEKGIFGNRVQALLDDAGNITAEARAAVADIRKEYEALKKAHDKDMKPYRKQLAKGKHPEKTPAMLAREDQLEALRPAYEKALLLGSFDLEDRHSKGFLGFGQRDSAATRMIEHYRERLADRKTPFDANSDEVFMYKKAVVKFRLDSIKNDWFLPLGRVLYSSFNIDGANLIKKIGGAKAQQNAAKVELDRAALLDGGAQFLQHAKPTEVAAFVEKLDIDMAQPLFAQLPASLQGVVENYAHYLHNRQENTRRHRKDELSVEQVKEGLALALLHRYGQQNPALQAAVAQRGHANEQAAVALLQKAGIQLPPAIAAQAQQEVAARYVSGEMLEATKLEFGGASYNARKNEASALAAAAAAQTSVDTGLSRS